MNERGEIMFISDIVSTKKTITIETNVTSTASIYYHSKNIRDCFILRTVFLAIMLLW